MQLPVTELPPSHFLVVVLEPCVTHEDAAARPPVLRERPLLHLSVAALVTRSVQVQVAAWAMQLSVTELPPSRYLVVVLVARPRW